MADASGFRFYDDPIARTGGSVAPYDASTGILTIPVPGVACPLDKVDEVVAAVRGRANQDVTDGVFEPIAIVDKDDGTPLLQIEAIRTGSPATITSIKMGTVTYSKAKALDFCAGADHFVLGL